MCLKIGLLKLKEKVFKENPEGNTRYCTHTKDGSICDKCLGRSCLSCEKRKKTGHTCGIINQEKICGKLIHAGGLQGPTYCANPKPCNLHDEKICPHCKAHYPASWEEGSHTCPPWMLMMKEIKEPKEKSQCHCVPNEKKEWIEEFDKLFNTIEIDGQMMTVMGNQPIKDFISSLLDTEVMNSYRLGEKHAREEAQEEKMINDLAWKKTLEDQALMKGERRRVVLQIREEVKKEVLEMIRKWKNEGDKPTETDLVLENILKEIDKIT